MSQRIFFYDDADLSARQNLHLTPGPVEKLGPMQWEERPCDLGRPSVFAMMMGNMPEKKSPEATKAASAPSR